MSLSVRASQCFPTINAALAALRATFERPPSKTWNQHIVGENDVLVPGKLNAARISNVLKAAGREDFLVKVFPDATHGVIAAPSPCSICIPNDEMGPILPWYAPGYWDTVTDWVAEHVAVNSEVAAVVR